MSVQILVLHTCSACGQKNIKGVNIGLDQGPSEIEITTPPGWAYHADFKVHACSEECRETLTDNEDSFGNQEPTRAERKLRAKPERMN